jgi:hypothetical protein
MIVTIERYTVRIGGAAKETAEFSAYLNVQHQSFVAGGFETTG